MSGHGYGEDCPECGENMECYYDSKDVEACSKDCYFCGHYEYYKLCDGKRTTEELIEGRIELEIGLDEYDEYVIEMNEKGEEPKTFEEWTKALVLARSL